MSDVNPYPTGYPGGYDFSHVRDQFYNIRFSGEPSLARTDADNPPFEWPKNYYRDSRNKIQQVQRGYMRSLVTDPDIAKGYNGAEGVPNRRLFFQFNPQVLYRSVQQSVGVMNPLLQDPMQLAQPIPGTANFGFQLFFNREAEVIHGKRASREEAVNLIEVIPGVPADVSQVGVLADIAVLDSIIGQGISNDMVNLIQGVAANQVKIANSLSLEQQKVYNPDTEQWEIPESEEFYKSYKEWKVPEDFGDLVTKNVGNSAFLNPLPIRVLFSTLFMVEGLVTSINVTFNKFSKTMVPVMCQVDINMYALYIGAAKKDTFLYGNLKESARIATRERQSNNTLKFTLEAIVPSLDFKFKARNTGGTVDFEGPFIGGSDNGIFRVQAKLNKALISTSLMPLLTDSEKKELLGDLFNKNAKDLQNMFFEKKEIKDLRAVFRVQYQLLSESNVPIGEVIREELQLKDGTRAVPYDKIEDGVDLYSSKEVRLRKLSGTVKKISCAFSFTFVASGKNGEDIETRLYSFPDVVYTFPQQLDPSQNAFYNYTSPAQTWTATRGVPFAPNTPTYP
jgi:hypothetical protein